MKEIEACLASLGIGLSLGLIGAGGSILTIPVLVYVLKIDPLLSSVYSMFVVGVSAIAGSIQFVFNKMVDFRITLLFGIPSVTGVWIARKIIFPAIPDRLFSIRSFNVSKNILFMVVLSLLMVFAAVRMLNPATLKKALIPQPNSYLKNFLLASQGLLVGITTGLLGIGGGFLIVPTLYFLAKLPMKTAIGTALLIISINSITGFATSYSSTEIDWMLLGKFSLGAIAGILIGAKLAGNIPAAYLKKIFGWFVLIVSVCILYRQILFE